MLFNSSFSVSTLETSFLTSSFDEEKLELEWEWELEFEFELEFELELDDLLSFELNELFENEYDYLKNISKNNNNKLKLKDESLYHRLIPEMLFEYNKSISCFNLISAKARLLL